MLKTAVLLTFLTAAIVAAAHAQQPGPPPGGPAGAAPGAGSAGAAGNPQRAATFQPAAAAPTTAAIDLPLPDKDPVRIPVFRTGGTAKSAFTAVVSGLQDGTGAPLTGTLSVPGQSGPELTAENGVVTLNLQVTPLPDVGSVTGLLTIAGETTSTWRLNLSRGGKPIATLAQDNPSITLGLTCDWLFGCDIDHDQDTATVRVWDKTRASPLTNVGVRLEQVSKAGTNFDAPKNLRTEFNGRPTDLWTMPKGPDPARSVPADGQGQVGLTVRNLMPGEYNATLRLLAANSLADDAQKVNVQVTVKHSVIWALAFVVLGLVVSLYGTKWLATLRKRLELESKITQLQAPWLKQEPLTAAVVWAIASLKLIREAARKSLLSIPDSLTARLDSVTSVVATLRSIHDIRTALAASHLEDNIPPFVVARAHGVLDGLVRRCSDPPLDAAVVTAITEDLKGLQLWLGPSTWDAPYWADLAPELRSLLRDVRPQDIADAGGRQAVLDLATALEPHAQENAPRPNDPVTVERQYAALKVLWERRRADEFVKLVTAQTTKTLEDVFQIADDTAWERLQKAIGLMQVSIEVSPPPQVLEPFTLSVVPADADLAATFLFRHRLQYDWRIDGITPVTAGKPRLLRMPSLPGKPFVLRPRTLQPMVSQYSPFALTLRPTVTIRRMGSTGSPVVIEGDPFDVTPSESLGIFSAFNALDVISTAVIGAAAAVSGLSTFYYGPQAFGSPKDYVALVLWALAFDQAKNGVIQISKS